MGKYFVDVYYCNDDSQKVKKVRLNEVGEPTRTREEYDKGSDMAKHFFRTMLKGYICSQFTDLIKEDQDLKRVVYKEKVGRKHKIIYDFKFSDNDDKLGTIMNIVYNSF